jgi:hypothetical protein
MYPAVPEPPGASRREQRWSGYLYSLTRASTPNGSNGTISEVADSGNASGQPRQSRRGKLRNRLS